MFSLIDTNPQVEIQETEYQRLLGYPKSYSLEGRSRELADEAQAWFSQNGRPWIWAREAASLELGSAKTRLGAVKGKKDKGDRGEVKSIAFFMIGPLF